MSNSIRERVPAVVGIDTSEVTDIFEKLSSVIGETTTLSLLYDYKNTFHGCYHCSKKFADERSVQVVPNWYEGDRRRRGRKMRDSLLCTLQAKWRHPRHQEVCDGCARKNIHEFVDAIFDQTPVDRRTVYKAMSVTLNFVSSETQHQSVAYRFYVALIQECFSRESVKHRANMRCVTELLTKLRLLT